MLRATRLPVSMLAAALLLAGCGKQVDEPAAEAPAAGAPAALASDAERMGYALGASVGAQFRSDKLAVDADALARGVRESFSGATLALDEQQIAEAMQKLQQSHAEAARAEQEAVATKNRDEGAAFLEGNKSAEGVVVTASGLQYKVLTAGDGAKPGADDTVKVHYRGTLIDGTEFDSSYARGEPVSFPVGAVIPGWTEALQLMPVGSKWQLFIPSDLAYGPGGAGDRIGPNTTLLFDVELLAIEPAAATDE